MNTRDAPHAEKPRKRIHQEYLKEKQRQHNNTKLDPGKKQHAEIARVDRRDGRKLKNDGEAKSPHQAAEYIKQNVSAAGDARIDLVVVHLAQRKYSVNGKIIGGKLRVEPYH